MPSDKIQKWRERERVTQDERERESSTAQRKVQRRECRAFWVKGPAGQQATTADSADNKERRREARSVAFERTGREPRESRERERNSEKA